MTVGELEIVQVVVSTKEGQPLGVSLTAKQRNLLLHYLKLISEGPIKVFHLPGVKMVPIKDLQNEEP